MAALESATCRSPTGRSNALRLSLSLSLGEGIRLLHMSECTSLHPSHVKVPKRVFSPGVAFPDTGISFEDPYLV